MAATPENGFQPFITIGPYFPMGGGGNTPALCPSKEAVTSELLATYSVYGGQTQAVTFGSNVGWDGNLEEAMRVWWLFKGVNMILSANGKYTDRSVSPPEQKDWSLTQTTDNPISFPGVPRPNKYGVSQNSERILNCVYQQNFAFEDQASQNIGELNYDNNFRVHAFKTDDNSLSAQFPDNVLIEFFCYVEPFSVDIPVTNAGIFIISTRDKDYTDVITEGSDQGVITQQVGARKTIPTTTSIAGVPIIFYASLFIINSNPNDFTIQDFDVNILNGNLWEKA